VSGQPVRVLVLYSHALMGEGLGRMLADEPGVRVDAVDSAFPEAVAAALAADPSVIVVEEGGPVDAAEVMRRSRCPLVLDVDITTTSAWTLRRELFSSRPDDFLAAIRQLVGGVVADPGEGEGATQDDRPLQPVRVSG
jgi:DNA-binding NarL/FixJ family response regulator